MLDEYNTIIPYNFKGSLRASNRKLLSEFIKDDFENRLLGNQDKDRITSNLFKGNDTILGIPVSISEDSLGKPLKTTIGKDNLIKEINVNIDNKDRKIFRYYTL
jgi:hypothetical protein